MKRRNFILVAALPVMGRAALAQPVRVPRIGLLIPESLSAMEILVDTFKAGLRELGYVEGRSIAIELRSANGRYESLRALADELVAAKVDLIVAVGTAASRAAKAATTTIPVVMAALGDPVGTGLVSSLARPGGNLTGTSNLSPPLVVKRLELLKECLPELRRAGLLMNPSNPAQAATLRAVAAAAQALRVELAQYGVSGLDEIRRVFSSVAADRVEAVVLANDPVLITNYAAIAEMAKKQRIRTAGTREFAEAGGLLGYGSATNALRLSATYVDKILRGAKAGELPIEQPSKYEVFLNLRTARAAEFAIPASFRLLRIDRVIE